MICVRSVKAATLSAFRKALLAIFLFILLGIFQGKNIVREQVEDSGFDAINKILSTSAQRVGDSDTNKVSVFVFDNTYMRQHGLYDESGVSKFGYVFPREHIASFLNRLDQYLLDLKQLTGGKIYCPKAVFIDIDTSYASGVNNALSVGDEALINTLAKPTRCYKVLLARGSKYNFIESATLDNVQLKKRFSSENPSVMFVSPDFHEGSDNIIRRNEPINVINGISYPSAAITLWQILKYNKTDMRQVQQFTNDVEQSKKPNKQALSSQHRVNVNANRIWIKHYRQLSAETKKKGVCGENSYWENLKKFSLSCSFKGLVPSPEYLDETVLLLGSAEKENRDDGLGRADYHKVLKFFVDDEMSGVDIHANSVMSLLHLDTMNNSFVGKLPQLIQLSWYKSLPIVFCTLFFVSLFSTFLLSLKNIRSDQAVFFVSTAVSTVIFFMVSLLLISSSNPMWFNWVVGVVLFQLVEVILFLRENISFVIRFLYGWLSRFLKKEFKI